MEDTFPSLLAWFLPKIGNSQQLPYVRMLLPPKFCVSHETEHPGHGWNCYICQCSWPNTKIEDTFPSPLAWFAATPLSISACCFHHSFVFPMRQNKAEQARPDLQPGLELLHMPVLVAQHKGKNETDWAHKHLLCTWRECCAWRKEGLSRYARNIGFKQWWFSCHMNVD